MAGDYELLELTFDSDEFDILTAGPMNFLQLPADHQLLVGYDKIRIIQAFDTIRHLHSNDSNRIAMNKLVAENLKSKKKFLEFSVEHQQDILNTYLDYLRALAHEGRRLVFFGLRVFAPALRQYIQGKRFTFFSTKSVVEGLDLLSNLKLEYGEFIPSQDFAEQTKHGGIQGAL